MALFACVKFSRLFIQRKYLGTSDKKREGEREKKRGGWGASVHRLATQKFYTDDANQSCNTPSVAEYCCCVDVVSFTLGIYVPD